MKYLLSRRKGKFKQARSQRLPARLDTTVSNGLSEEIQDIRSSRTETQQAESKLRPSGEGRIFDPQALNEDTHPQVRRFDDWSHLKPDESGGELGREARVWKVYVGETDRWDREVVQGWESSMDVLLVFAALFSAISTAFLVESSSMLKQDPNDISAATLLVISQTLTIIVAGNSSSNPTTLPQPGPINGTDFAPPKFAVIVNALWYTSLSLSIATAFLAMLVKDWCYSFFARRTGHPQDQAYRRQRKWKLIEHWKMKELIIVLPSLMHLSLLLFSVGLCVYLWNLNHATTIPVVCIAGLFVTFYIWSSVTASIVEYFPYTTIISQILRSNYMLDFYQAMTIFRPFIVAMIGSLFFAIGYTYGILMYTLSALTAVITGVPFGLILLLDRYSLQWFAKPGELEDTLNIWGLCFTIPMWLLFRLFRYYIHICSYTWSFTTRTIMGPKLTDNLTASLALGWLIDHCETSSAVDIALQAIAGASPGDSKEPLLLSRATQQILRRMVSNSVGGSDKSTHSRYIRGLEFLGADTGSHSDNSQIRTNQDLQAIMRDLISKNECKIADLIQKGNFIPSDNNLEAMRIGKRTSSQSLLFLMGEARGTTDTLNPIIELLSHHFESKDRELQLHPAAVQSLANAAALHLSLSEIPDLFPNLVNICMDYCRQFILEGSQSGDKQSAHNIETTVIFIFCVLLYRNPPANKPSDTLELLAQPDTRTSHAIRLLAGICTNDAPFQNEVLWIACTEILYNSSYYSLGEATDYCKPLKDWCSERTSNFILKHGSPSIPWWRKGFFEILSKEARDRFLTVVNQVSTVISISRRPDSTPMHLPDPILMILTVTACSNWVDPWQRERCFELLSKNSFPKLSTELVASLRMRTNDIDNLGETVLSSIGMIYINKSQSLSQRYFAAAQLWLLLHLASDSSSIHQPGLNRAIEDELGDTLELQSKGFDRVRNDLEIFIIQSYRQDLRTNNYVEDVENKLTSMWTKIKIGFSVQWVGNKTQTSPFSIGSGLKLVKTALQTGVKDCPQINHHGTYMARVVEYILQIRGLEDNEDLMALLAEDLKEVAPNLRKSLPEPAPLPPSRATSRKKAAHAHHSTGIGHVSIGVHDLWEHDSDLGLGNLFDS